VSQGKTGGARNGLNESIGGVSKVGGKKSLIVDPKGGTSESQTPRERKEELPREKRGKTMNT